MLQQAKGLPQKNKKFLGKIPKKYRRIYRSLTQKDTKLVLSLGGGGVRMFAHAAAFRFLESLGVEAYLSEIWGASAGAIVGALYSHGQSPNDIEEEGLRVHNNSDHFPAIPSALKMAGRVLQDAFLPIQKKGPMKAFHDYQMAFLNRLKEKIKDKVPRHKLYFTAYNLATNENDILTPHQVPKTHAGLGVYHTETLEAVTASSAIPILFKPKEIKDEFGKRQYMDGAMVEEVPMVSLYKKWRRDREMGLEKKRRLLVIAIHLNPSFTSMDFLQNWLVRRLPGYEYLFLSMNFANFMRKARNQAQRRALMEDPNVELWEINLNLSNASLLNFEIIPEVIHNAETSFPKQFEKINKSLLI